MCSSDLITIHTWPEIDELVAAVRSMRPDVVIVARARDADHARHLYELGVSDAVPETIEASLQLSEAVLGLRELRPGDVAQTDAVLRRFKFAELRRTDVRAAIDLLLGSRTFH